MIYQPMVEKGVLGELFTVESHNGDDVKIFL